MIFIPLGKTTDTFGQLKFWLPDKAYRFKPKLVLEIEKVRELLVSEFMVNSTLINSVKIISVESMKCLNENA